MRRIHDQPHKRLPVYEVRRNVKVPAVPFLARAGKGTTIRRCRDCGATVVGDDCARCAPEAR